MGAPDQAETHLLRQLALFEAESGERSAGALSALGELVKLRFDQGRIEAAGALLERERGLLIDRDPEDQARLSNATNLASLHLRMGRYEAALPLLEESIETKTRVLGPAHPSTLTSMNNLAGLYSSTGRYEASSRLYEAVIAGRTEALGSGHPRTLTTCAGYGFTLSMGGGLIGRWGCSVRRSRSRRRGSGRSTP